MLSFGEEGTGPGMLKDPRAIGVDRNGNIYVADYSDGRIQIFDPQDHLVFFNPELRLLTDRQQHHASLLEIGVRRTDAEKILRVDLHPGSRQK